MKIWLTEIGEPLPIDAGARLMRCGLLAQTLASRDHDVTWWASTFDHARKLYRRPSSETASPGIVTATDDVGANRQTYSRQECAG